MAVKIKICGLKRTEDIEYVNRYRPDYAGFVFFPPSSRYVTVEKAKELSSRLAPGITPVGVFLDNTLDEILEVEKSGAVKVLQLHGKTAPELVRKLKEISSLPVWEAIEVKSAADLQKAADSQADMILLDHGAGGTGKSFDWTLLEHLDRDYFLAGGLDASNVVEALKHRPYGVDTSSGVETNHMKDCNKIRTFIQTVRSEEENKKMSESKGRFGIHGGQYIPETLMNAVIELEEAYNHYKDDPDFNAELSKLFNEYVGRPSLLYYADKMTKDLGGAKIYLKREDLNHTGAHKINNALGQVLLAKKMGKTRIIAETGAGQHGVATATAAALLGMECVVFMGEEDTRRQALNVYRMKLLGASVVPVTTGTATLKDAVSECMREWTNRIEDTHYCLGSVMGPHPFPTIVRDFQAVISKEIKTQILEKEGKLPDAVVACVGGGSNAIGSFYHFINDQDVQLIGCEAAGRGIDTFETAATINTGREGIFHGMKSYFCQDKYGQIAPVYSISAGLDYPGIGPEHAWLHDIGRAQYVAITDEEAVNAFEYLSRMEGIIPAIESAHAVAYACKLAPTMAKDQIMVITLSGRGDKDCAAIGRYRGEALRDE